MACMLAFAPAASARVTVVPGEVQGGGTETFAVRLSNEQPDLVTTRLELSFPADVVIPRVEVAPVGKWRAKVDMRRVDPPVTVDGEEVDEAVASIVWTGGEIAPKQFEQFLVTAGPLPVGGGRLVLAAAQGYEDGTVDRWTGPARPGWPGAPTITITPSSDAAPADRPAESGRAPVQVGAGPAAAAAAVEPVSAGTGVLPWILLAVGVLVAGVATAVGYRQQERRKRLARRRLTSTKIRKLPTGAGRR
ncbi:YcnI family protein [Pseudonocardia cypriaca]|nr:YcnI family protein [Pseudonocardia cypriaca]